MDALEHVSWTGQSHALVNRVVDLVHHTTQSHGLHSHFSLKLDSSQYRWELLTVDSNAGDLRGINGGDDWYLEVFVRVGFSESRFRQPLSIFSHIHGWAISTFGIPDVRGWSFSVVAEILQINLATAGNSNLALDIVLIRCELFRWSRCTLSKNRYRSYSIRFGW